MEAKKEWRGWEVGNSIFSFLSERKLHGRKFCRALTDVGSRNVDALSQCGHKTNSANQKKIN